MTSARSRDLRPASLRTVHRLLATLAVLPVAVVTWGVMTYGLAESPLLVLFSAAIVGTVLITIGMTS